MQPDLGVLLFLRINTVRRRLLRCYGCAVKSETSKNAPSQQRTHLHACLRDMVLSSPHLCSTFVLDVLSSADCPPNFREDSSPASVSRAQDPNSVLAFCSCAVYKFPYTYTHIVDLLAFGRLICA